mgnify:CR=1 FL=1
MFGKTKKQIDTYAAVHTALRAVELALEVITGCQVFPKHTSFSIYSYSNDEKVLENFDAVYLVRKSDGEITQIKVGVLNLAVRRGTDNVWRVSNIGQSTSIPEIFIGDGWRKGRDYKKYIARFDYYHGSVTPVIWTHDSARWLSDASAENWVIGRGHTHGKTVEVKFGSEETRRPDLINV